MKQKILLFIGFAIAVIFGGCSDEPSNDKFDGDAYFAGDRIPDKVLVSNSWSEYMTFTGSSSILVYGPENGYSEDTWHFEENVGSVFYWPYKKLYLVYYTDYEKSYNQILNWLDLYLSDQPITMMQSNHRYVFTPLLSPQIINDKDNNNVTFYSLNTPDKKRTYEIYAGQKPILLANYDNHFVVLPDSESDLPLILLVEDNYYKGGNSGGGGSVPNTSRVSTEVFEIWVHNFGWDENVKSSTHLWYKAEVNGKMCLYKTSMTSDFMVASRNNDTEFKGYNVSYYRYKVVEPTITSGTNYYYFN